LQSFHRTRGEHPAAGPADLKKNAKKRSAVCCSVTVTRTIRYMEIFAQRHRLIAHEKRARKETPAEVISSNE
jgi:hypothetical protein